MEVVPGVKVIGPHRLARLGPGRKRAMSAAIGQAMQVHLFLGYMDSKRIRLQNIEMQYLKLNWSRQILRVEPAPSRWIESNQEKENP